MFKFYYIIHLNMAVWFLPQPMRAVIDQPGSHLFSTAETYGPLPQVDDPSYFEVKQEYMDAAMKDMPTVFEQLQAEKTAAEHRAQQEAAERYRVQTAQAQFEERLMRERELESVVFEKKVIEERDARRKEEQGLKQRLTKESQSREQAEKMAKAEALQRAAVEQRLSRLAEEKMHMDNVFAEADAARTRLVEQVSSLVGRRDELAASEARYRRELEAAREDLDRMREIEQERTMGPVRKLRRALAHARQRETYRPPAGKFINMQDALKMKLGALGRDTSYLNVLHGAAMAAYPSNVAAYSSVNDQPFSDVDKLTDPYILGVLRRFKK